MDGYRGRYAPSPTGEMHLGNAWTALLSWLHARSHGGQFILRIEDLDPERSRPAYEAQLLDDLRWLGLDWEEGPEKEGPFGPYRQSERFPYYRQLLADFRQEGRLYACSCTRAPKGSGTGALPSPASPARSPNSLGARPLSIARRWRACASVVCS